MFEPAAYRSLLHDAAAIVLISFASGMLTAKSFARRNHYEIDANQELIAFGASNLASGLAQGFPVTGADSRTAVNNAVGGKSQLVGIVAAATMLFALLFLKAPLALVPTAALAAVVFVSAIGLFDVTGLRDLARMSWREGLLSLGTTLGVLVLGVLPGVMLAVALSLAWLLMVASRPQDAVLGRVPGLPGFHSVADYPKATTVPGLLLYRFEANLVFFNVDYFGERLRAAIRGRQDTGRVGDRRCQPDQLDRCDRPPAPRRAAERAGGAGNHARLRPGRALAGPGLQSELGRAAAAATGLRRFPTLKAAVHAFEQHKLDADADQAAQVLRRSGRKPTSRSDPASGAVIWRSTLFAVAPDWRRAGRRPRQTFANAPGEVRVPIGGMRLVVDQALRFQLREGQAVSRLPRS